MDNQYAYLLVNLGCIAIPFLFSFEHRISFYKKWKAFFPAAFITLAFFVIWDIIFTDMGIWGFNPVYLTGIEIANLPIEEWLFFICIPYACTFTYEAFRLYFKKPPFGKATKIILWAIVFLNVMLALLNYGIWYTFFTNLFTALFLLILLLWIRPKFMGWALLTYFVITIPFLISNGVLTGLDFWNYALINTDVNDIYDQIVWYNNAHNLGVRIFSIPVDDFIYGFLLIVMNIVLYEAFLKRQ
jgi:lycopene cyclase domain-containing protein